VNGARALRLPLPVFEPPPRLALERRRWTSRDDILVLYPGPDAVMLRSAGPADARAIHALLAGFAEKGLLLHRTLNEVCRSIRDFVVGVENGRVVGCGALRIYSETLAEVGALAVAEDWHGRGIGARIVNALKQEARMLDIQRVFALTLQDRFFHKLGFRTVDVREFPQKISGDCAKCDLRSTCSEIAVACELDDAFAAAVRA
jgi:amino-acid N-acetyltransferase